VRCRELAVPGAYAFEPSAYPDERGSFVTTYQRADFVAAVGRPLFPVAQVSQSTSRRGVVRGVHYTLTGTAKYVQVMRGRVLDVAVDLRTGSPTFGRIDQVELTGDNHVAVYLPAGVGHAFEALEDGTVVCYLLSREYVAADELAVSALDPALALPFSGDAIRSERDRKAPTLAEAVLPGYSEDLA
jgi:epimerase EvaD